MESTISTLENEGEGGGVRGAQDGGDADGVLVHGVNHGLGVRRVALRGEVHILGVHLEVVGQLLPAHLRTARPSGTGGRGGKRAFLRAWVRANRREVKTSRESSSMWVH